MSRKKLSLVSLTVATVALFLQVSVAQACTYTPGWWKNHPEAWPTETIGIGGVTYTKAEAIALLDTSIKGDHTYILAHLLIAAKLTTWDWGADTPSDWYSVCDDLLVENPLGSKPNGDAREEIVYWAGVLDWFVNSMLED